MEKIHVRGGNKAAYLFLFFFGKQTIESGQCYVGLPRRGACDARIGCLACASATTCGSTKIARLSLQRRYLSYRLIFQQVRPVASVSYRYFTSAQASSFLDVLKWRGAYAYNRVDRTCKSLEPEEFSCSFFQRNFNEFYYRSVVVILMEFHIDEAVF